MRYQRGYWPYFLLNVCLTIAYLLVLTRFAHSQANNSTSATLPSPSGRFAIGRVTLHLTDNSRVETLAPDHRNRELMIDVWYPAEPQNGPRAPYLDAAAFERALGAKGLHSLLGDRATEIVAAGLIQTHASEGAPFARPLKHVPLLIFSHGMGTVTQIHTAQIEDLVSHGYVVAAINHTYDAWLTVFPDGRAVPFEYKIRPSNSAPQDQRIAYENTRVEWWANDIRFVVDALTRQNRVSFGALPFAGHLDFKRVGAFGHSVGGRAAARACQLDHRFRACADQDGVVGMLPFYLNEHGWGVDQPFMLIDRVRTTAPTEEELRRWGKTREQVNEEVAQLRAHRDATLARVGGGAYRVVLSFAPTNHMSFSDLMLLQSRDEAEATIRARILRVTCDYTRAFFDKTLRGMKAPLLDGGTTGEFIESIQRLPPAQKTRPKGRSF